MGYNKPHIATQTTRFLCHCWFVFGSRTCGVHDFCRAHLGSIASYGFWLPSCVETAGGSSSDFEPLSIPMGWCGLGWQNMGGVMLLPSHLWGLEATFLKDPTTNQPVSWKMTIYFFFSMPRFRCLKSRDRSIMVCLEREGLTHDRLRIRGLALSQSPAFCCVFVGLSLVFWFIGLALPSAFQPDKTFWIW